MRFPTALRGGVIGVGTWMLCATALIMGIASAQQPVVSVKPEELLRSRPTSGRANLRLDVSLVLIPLTVTDSLDRPVTDLPKDSFRVFEDDVEQKIASLVREEGPVSVGFIFDNSRSMKGRLDESIKAVEQFLAAMLPGDEFFLIRFSDRPTVIRDFTGDPNEILSSLSFVRPDGWTALNDAIYLGVQRLKSAKNSRRALFVLTDGGDNNSRYSEWEVRDLVRESDLRVYSIGLFERSGLLDKLADDSGGASFCVRKLDQLPAVVERLSQQFRSQYVLGYLPDNRRNDGKYRKVKVELLQPTGHTPLHVLWRRGYFAPPD
jgi:Ca-activated chloride channel homolog